MMTEQLTRSHLTRQCTKKIAELRQQGQDSRHLERFLRQIENLQGQTVGDLCHYWTQSQAEARPLWTMILVGLCSLVGLLALKLTGLTMALVLVTLIGALGLAHLDKMWEQEGTFLNELLARADACVYSYR